jgi:hypothetical protein
MGGVKCDHIKRLITLTSDNIKWLSLFFNCKLNQELSYFNEFFISISIFSDHQGRER